MSKENHMQIFLDAKSVNESVARMAVAAFMMDMNPDIETLGDVKTAVSEAVTNAIIHGYGGHAAGAQASEPPKVEISCARKGRELTVTVADEGVGIADVERAMEPLYTTKPDMERSGMGFAFMEAFMDELQVISSPGKGTRVIMKKYIQADYYGTRRE